MEAIVLNDIPVTIDEEAFKKHFRVRGTGEMTENLGEMMTQARSIAKPKAVYKEVYVNEITEDSVIIDGISFKSRVMRSNLENVGRLFASVVTCGLEIHEWSLGFKDMMDKFWADSIMEFILMEAGEYLFNYLNNVYELGKSGFMSPGSISDWPVTGQAQLFKVIGDVKKLIGVELTDRFLLFPLKSVSGLVFPSDISYVNCMLCTKPNCTSRRAPFDAELYKEKLG